MGCWRRYISLDASSASESPHNRLAWLKSCGVSGLAQRVSSHSSHWMCFKLAQLKLGPIVWGVVNCHELCSCSCVLLKAHHILEFVCVSEIGQDCWKSIWMVTKNHRLQKDLKHGNRSCSIPSCFSHRWVHQNLDQLRHRNTAVAEDSTSWLEGSSLARATIEEELNTNHV